MYKITTREEYDYALSRGIDALIDSRFDVDIALRKELQKEFFGKNNREGNARFYRYCLYHLPHICEECGRVIQNPSAVNVSHILSRGAWPAFSHDCRNVNILCYEHHAKWENGNRQEMKIYEKNQRTIEKLKKEYYNV